MLRPARPARQDQEKLVATGSEQMKNARTKASSSWMSPLIPVRWSASEGDIVQVGPDRGVSPQTSEQAARRGFGRTGSTPVTVNPPGWAQAHLTGAERRNWPLPFLRDVSSYLFVKRSQGKQVQNLRLPRSADLFLLNSDWSNKGRMQMWLFTSPSVLSERHW